MTQLKHKFIDLDNKDEAGIYLANMVRVLTEKKKKAINEEEATQVIEEVIVKQKLTSDAHNALVRLRNDGSEISATFKIKRGDWGKISGENIIKQLIDSYINYDRNLLNAWKKY